MHDSGKTIKLEEEGKDTCIVVFISFIGLGVVTVSVTSTVALVVDSV